MIDVGFDRPLYVLPFDHRGSFQSGLFGWKGALTTDQTARVSASKRIIYDGLLAAVAGGVPKERTGILVDEQFGAEILRDAAARGFPTAAPAEKSGQQEFDFEYGDDFARHVEAFSPTFCKVLVRYNPEGDAQMNRRQAGRLRRLSEWLHAGGRKLMFVRRTTFWDALVSWRDGRMTRDTAVADVARRYTRWRELFRRGTASR